jgi:hypothetical protein
MGGCLLVTGYCYGVVPYEASHALPPFSDLLCVSTWELIIHDSSTRALWHIPAEAPSREVGRESWREIPLNFAGEVTYLCHTPQDF